MFLINSPIYSTLNVNKRKHTRMEGEWKHITAYKFIFSDLAYSKGAQAKRTAFDLKLLQLRISPRCRCHLKFTYRRKPALYVRILAKVFAIGPYHSLLL